MAYTRVWDETFPPDTQNANLLGQDIRNFKDDIRERVTSFGAGLLADRPSPESVWGGATAGVMFYATDVNTLFRWNGAAWVTVRTFGSQQTLFINPAQTTVANPGVDTVIQTVTIPANTLQVNDIVSIKAPISLGGTSGSVFINVFGVDFPVFVLPSSGVTTAYFMVDLVMTLIGLTGSYTAVWGSPGGAFGNNNPTVQVGNNINTTGGLTIAAKVKAGGNGNFTSQFIRAMIERL
jgi:hypothetical protein